MTTTQTARVLGDDDADHVIPIRILDRTTFCGKDFVRWEPVERLTGPLAFYNGFSRGALMLPVQRLVEASAR